MQVGLVQVGDEPCERFRGGGDCNEARVEILLDRPPLGVGSVEGRSGWYDFRRVEEGFNLREIVIGRHAGEFVKLSLRQNDVLDW